MRTIGPKYPDCPEIIIAAIPNRMYPFGGKRITKEEAGKGSRDDVRLVKFADGAYSNLTLSKQEGCTDNFNGTVPQSILI